MAFVSRHCSVSKATASCSGCSLRCTSANIPFSRSRRASVIRNSYQTDTDTQPRAPDAAPGRWGAAPPPPPPPPPPPKQPVTGGAPSRREAMFGLLGAALGVGVTTAYYKAQYPDDPESFQEALDQLLDDPDFLEAVADELLYQEYEDVNADVNSGITKMRNKLLTDQVETAEAEGASK